MGCTRGPSWFPSTHLGVVNPTSPSVAAPIGHLEPRHTLNLQKSLPSLRGTLRLPGRDPEGQRVAASLVRAAGEHPAALDAGSGVVLCDMGPVLMELLVSGRREGDTGSSTPDHSVCGDIY